MNSVEGRGGRKKVATGLGLHEQAVDLSDSIAEQIVETGTAKSGQFATLRRMAALIKIRSQLRAPRSQRPLFLFVMLSVFALVLVLATTRRSSSYASLVVKARNATLSVPGQRLTTRQIFASSDRVEVDVRGSSLPASCARTSQFRTSGSQLIVASTSRSSPLSIGDDSQAVLADTLMYSTVDKDTLALVALDANAGSGIATSIGIPQGTIAMRQPQGPEQASSSAEPVCYARGDQVDIDATYIAFKPVESVGPVFAKQVEFRETRVAGSVPYDVSTINSARISFSGISAEPIQVDAGSAVEIVPTEPVRAVLTPTEDGVQVMVRGMFSSIRVGDLEIRPTCLEELWSSPLLKRIAAALSASLAFLIAIAQRLGIRE